MEITAWNTRHVNGVCFSGTNRTAACKLIVPLEPVLGKGVSATAACQSEVRDARSADSDAACEGAELCNVSKMAPVPESQHRLDLWYSQTDLNQGRCTYRDLQRLAIKLLIVESSPHSSISRSTGIAMDMELVDLLCFGVQGRLLINWR